MRLFALILLVLPLISAPASTREAIGEERLGLWRVAALPWYNPAMNQWRMPQSLTRVGACLSRRDDGHEWRIGADTYTRLNSSVLWGSAAYGNGRDSRSVWCETADRDIVYPYILADSIGGDISRERYSFSGGYADRNGRWAWGAAMSYEATLEYRAVDPRPRNVAGCLDASVGLAFDLGRGYHAGASINFRKYKQSNDIEFKSEMGIDKIFHLTGMGTHYSRFAGTGLSTHYDGCRYGATADIWPASGCGLFASVNLSRFSFDNILTELNKLPMASVWHRSIDAEAGVVSEGETSYMGAAAYTGAWRRRGRENVFGDASAGIFPLICSNDMYADNGTSAGIRAMWGLKYSSGNRVAIMVDAAWGRRITTYVEPWRQGLVNNIKATFDAGAELALPRGWLVGVGTYVCLYRPFSCSLVMTGTGIEPDMAQLEALVESDFEYASEVRTRVGGRLSAAHAVGRRYMLQLAVGVRHHDYDLSISIMF